MAKTCGDCEKSIESGLVEKNRDTVKRWCRCSVTGKDHLDSYQCDVPEKPRLCEVLGVEVGERFYVRDDLFEKALGPFCVSGGGDLILPDGELPNVAYALIEAINRPGSIERLPRLTPEEVQRCRDFGAKWVSRDGDGERVDLWGSKPERAGGVWMGAQMCANSWKRFFPSVLPGQLVPVEDEP